MSTYIRRTYGHQKILKPLPRVINKRDALVELLSHANENVEFYRGKYSDFLNAEPELSDFKFWQAFESLPVVSKNDLIEFNGNFLADHLNPEYDLLAGGKAPGLFRFLWHGLIRKDFCVSISTGGTSGRSAFRWLDYHDSNAMAQSFLESFHLNGWRRGEDFVVFYPLRSYFTGAYATQARRLRRLFGFTMVPFEEIDKETVLRLLKTLKKTRASLLVIFPCVLQRVAEIMREENLPPFEDLPYINVSGEFFLDCSKKFIQEYFPNSDIQSTYGAVEFGEIAHQSGNSSFDYDVFPDYAHVEEGADDTLLITAMQQRAFPLIRYQIEDKATVETDVQTGLQRLVQLEGKNTDYLINVKGQRVYASYFNRLINQCNVLNKHPVIHFMLRHDGAQIQANFVLRDPSDEAMAQKVQRFFEDHLCQEFGNYKRVRTDIYDHFDHDYTRKFKVIGEGDGLAEVVGGYYQRKAS